MKEKVLKIAKINIKEMIKPVVLFYLIIFLWLMISWRAMVYADRIPFKGMEIFTIAFLIIFEIMGFKRSFNFAQVNNISRKSYIKGIIISGVALSLILSIIDFTINRSINIFCKLPSFYDIEYGNFRGIDQLLSSSRNWVQDTSLVVMTNTIFLLFLTYCIAYGIGIIIALLRYRFNELGKVGALAIIIIESKLLRTGQPRDLFYGANEYFKRLLNLGENNIILIFIIYGVIFLIIYMIANLLIRKATLS